MGLCEADRVYCVLVTRTTWVVCTCVSVYIYLCVNKTSKKGTKAVNKELNSYVMKF